MWIITNIIKILNAIFRTTWEYIDFRRLQYCPQPSASDNIEDQESQYIQFCPKDIIPLAHLFCFNFDILKCNVF